MSFRITGSSEFAGLYTPQPDGGELASQAIGLLGISVMCTLFGIKTYNVQYKYLSYSRWLVLLLYMFSWAFTFTGLILMSTNNGNSISCLLSEMACDVFYSGTKITIYLWLIEKVWVVNAGRTSRWQTKSYRFHILLLTPYIAIFSLMIIFHNAWLESDGLCSIGLKPVASIPLIVYDFIINMYMTVLFILPLMKIGTDTNVDWKQSRLHEVAKRTTLASVVCLIASFANVTALAILDGHERGVICLTCCFVDVMVNVVTVHWVTSQPAGRTTRDTEFSNNNNNPYSDDGLKNCSGGPCSPSNTVNEQQSSTHTDNSCATVVNLTNVIPTDKKKRFRFDPTSEQYGEFGHHAWSSVPEYTASTDDYSTHHYMSATNTQIYTSPANADIADYHYRHHHHQQPQSNVTSHAGPAPYHFTNGRFVMVSEREEDDFQTTSQTSYIQESHSSKKSLTKVPSNASSYLPNF